MTESPNSFATAEQVAATAAVLAGTDLGLGELVHRDVEKDYNAGGGDTVYVPVPGATEVHTRGVRSLDPLTGGAVIEQTIPVTLTEEVYSSVPISRGDETLDLTSYARQVLRPQTIGIVRHITAAVASAMSATPVAEGITYDPTKPRAAFIAARRTLRTNGVDADTPLLAVVGAGIYADLLTADALDEGGKVAGVSVHESTRLAEGELIVFVRNAFALAVRAPLPPEGAAYAASAKEEGMAVTVVRAFDATVGADRSIVSTFVGARAMPLPVANEATGKVDLIDNGGAVRILAA